MQTAIPAGQATPAPVTRPAASDSTSINNPAARARVKKAAREFEALLIEHMLKTARTPVPGKALLGESAGHDVYQGLADEQFARALSQGRGLGLGEMLYRGVVRTDQKRPSSAAPSAPIQEHGETQRVGRAAL